MAAHGPGMSRAAINFAASGDNTVIAAVVGAPILVFGIFFTVAGATNITFKDGTTSLSGAVVFTANGSAMTLQINDEPYFYCQPGDAFIMNNSSAVQVSGTVYYRQGG
jgi:hypothetical protein